MQPIRVGANAKEATGPSSSVAEAYRWAYARLAEACNYLGPHDAILLPSIIQRLDRAEDSEGPLRQARSEVLEPLIRELLSANSPTNKIVLATLARDPLLARLIHTSFCGAQSLPSITQVTFDADAVALVDSAYTLSMASNIDLGDALNPARHRLEKYGTLGLSSKGASTLTQRNESIDPGLQFDVSLLLRGLSNPLLTILGQTQVLLSRRTTRVRTPKDKISRPPNSKWGLAPRTLAGEYDLLICKILEQVAYGAPCAQEAALFVDACETAVRRHTASKVTPRTKLLLDSSDLDALATAVMTASHAIAAHTWKDSSADERSQGFWRSPLGYRLEVNYSFDGDTVRATPCPKRIRTSRPNFVDEVTLVSEGEIQDHPNYLPFALSVVAKSFSTLLGTEIERRTNRIRVDPGNEVWTELESRCVPLQGITYRALAEWPTGPHTIPAEELITVIGLVTIPQSNLCAVLCAWRDHGISIAPAHLLKRIDDGVLERHSGLTDEERNLLPPAGLLTRDWAEAILRPLKQQWFRTSAGVEFRIGNVTQDFRVSLYSRPENTSNRKMVATVRPMFLVAYAILLKSWLPIDMPESTGWEDVTSTQP